MSQNHSGNIQPQLDLEEHDGDLNAKRVSLVSAPTIYIVGDIGLTPTFGARATIGNATLLNTPVLIAASDTTRRSIIVRNISSATVFIGNSSAITASIGMPLKQDDALTLDQYDGEIYGIADATGQPVRFIAELD